ncbi:MAG: hypothetical protein IJP72_03565 [Bacteroidales bacterium]|nr:hypothetical protein [Bacteroidales bacterium]
MKKKQLLFATLVAFATSTGFTACSSDNDDTNTSGGNQIDETNVVNDDASNLLTITPYKGYDPEVSSGTDSGAYPASRTFTFGVNVTL